MEPSVSYSLMGEDGEVVRNFTNSACFSALGDSSLRKKTHSIILKVCVHADVKDHASWYLDSLRTIGFCIVQPTKDIIKTKKYTLDLEHIRQDGTVSLPEVMGTLTVIRYLWESTGYVLRMKAVHEELPEIPLWDCLQLAHLYVFGNEHNMPINRLFGNGHSLLGNTSWSPQGVGKTWNRVRILQRNLSEWNSKSTNFHIHECFGSVGGLGFTDVKGLSFEQAYKRLKSCPEMQ